MRYSILVMLLTVGGFATGVVEAGTLRAGAAAIDITPEALPVSMTGSFQDRKATGVHDRLHARALVIDDGQVRFAMVICDSCLIPRPIHDAAKRIASQKTGIPVSRMLTAATHTHTAPTALKAAQCTPDPKYIEHLTKGIAESIVAANNKLQPVEIGWGSTEVKDEVSNRRWFIKSEAMRANPFGTMSDKVKMNPPRGTGVLIRAAGPVDPEVRYLSLRTKTGKPLSLWANYGLHYVGGIAPNQISADYFGEFARRIGDKLQADSKSFVGAMTNGTSGDVNNYQFPNARPRSGYYERMEAVAEKVASRVHESHQGLRFRKQAKIQTAEREIELAVRKPTAEELKRARKLFENAADPARLNMEELYAQESIRLHEAPATVRLKLQTYAIDDLAIVAIPCEVFAEIGLEIKRRSPYKSTFIIELANGYNGYLPTPKQHALGGYETWRSGWSYLETDASTKITNTALEMLVELQAKVLLAK